MKVVKKFLKLLLLIITVCVLYLLLICVFHEQCKDITKKYIFHTVKENQEVLRKAVEQIAETDEQYITSKTYPEVGIWHEELNSDSLTQAFKKLNLFYVCNNMDSSQAGIVEFLPKIGRSLFINGNLFESNTFIMCGFYYSEEDIPVDVFYTNEECEEVFDGKWGFMGEYHYQTEQIAPNWWYYEVEDTTYPVKERR